MGASRKLRVVQVGCGGRAQPHIAAMLESGAVDLVGVCDLDKRRLKATADKFGIANRSSDMAEMIRSTEPELVDIVTPPTLRAAIVEPAIAAGAPALLIEKPIALTPSEMRRLVELGQDRLIAVNTQYQWMPHWQRIWQLLREQQFGEIRLIRASTGCNILEQGPHILDLALKAATIAGLPAPEWVLAACAGREYFGDIPVPADTVATIGLGDARLHLNAGPSAPPVPRETEFWFQHQVELIGSRGRAWVSCNQGWQLWFDGGFEAGATGWPRNDGEAQRALFTDLRDTLHKQADAWRAFPTHIQAAARNADVMFGCYASALEGARVGLGQQWPDSIVEGRKMLAPGE